MSKLTPTTEQQEIIQLSKEGKDISIQAFAGCTKTSTLEFIAQARMKETLYIAFNKSIAGEASKKFPEWVTCKTLHSLAWNAIVKGTGFGKKGRLVGYYDNREIAEMIENSLKGMSLDEEYLTIQYVVDIIKEFCQSAEESVIGFTEKYFEAHTELNKENLNNFQNMAKNVWDNLSSSRGSYKLTHDIYLKLYQLSKPDLSEDYKVIMLDEAQDSNPVTLDIFYRQAGKCQLIMVGDKFQAIYAWRGAVNALENIPPNFQEMYLTTNFRFRQELADKVNPILSYMGSTKGIIGKGSASQVETRATLVRNNATLFNLLLLAEKEGKKVHVIADLKELFSQMYTAAALLYCRKGEKPNFGQWPHKRIASYKSWKELIKDKSPEIQKIAKLVSNCEPSVHDCISRVKSAIVATPEEADFILVTGHKSKGMEWDEVTLADDFLPYTTEDEDLEEKLEEFIASQGLNLLYVALTRARSKLVLSYTMEEFLEFLTLGGLKCWT